MQSKDQSLPKKNRTVAAKIANVLSYILVFVFFSVLIIFLFLQTPPGQNFVRGKVESWLGHKLKTKVVIGKLKVHFPNSVELRNVYIEDQTKDTLISGGMLKVDLNLLKLITNEVQIKEIKLEDIMAKIKRVNQDTVFNFQFIVDAFMNNQKDSSAIHDSSTLNMNIDNIVFNRVRLLYKDVISGDDMDIVIEHLDAPIKKFDPDHLYFDIPTFTLRGLKGFYYQNEPLKPKIDSAVAHAILQPDNFLRIKNSEILLQDIDLDYRSVPTNLTTYLKFNKLVAHPDTLDIKSLKFAFRDISLDTSHIALSMGPGKVKPASRTPEPVKEVLSSFTISSDAVTIRQGNFKLDNSSMPVTNYGMDYGHMDIKDIDINATNVMYNLDTTMVTIQKARLKEKSGFVLNDLNTDFLFTNTGVSLKNLYIKTPGTILRRDLAITYPSLDKLVQNPFTLKLDLDIQSSSVQVKDVLTFAPMLRSLPAFANPSQVWQLNGRIYGPLTDLHFNDLRFKGLSNTTFFASGSLKGLPDPNKFVADLNIKYLVTGRKDIIGLIPKGSVPTAFTLPESIRAAGHLKAGINDLVSDLTVSTSLGSARLKGSLTNYSNPKLARYNYYVSTGGFDLGTLMKDKATYGKIAGNFTIQGSGLDPNTMSAKANGTLTALGYNGYTYRNIHFDGNIANGAYNINAAVKDPNADLSFVAEGTFSGKYPSIRFTADIDSIKTQALRLTPQPVVYHGKMEGSFSNLDPDNLSGDLFITNSILVTNGQRTQLDSVRLVATNTNGLQYIRLQTPFLFAEINGHYKLTQLGDIVMQSIDPYFSLGGKPLTYRRTDPHDFTINAKAYDNPALRAFVPELKKMDSLSLSASFTTQSGMSAKLSAPVIVYGTQIINDIMLDVVTKNNQLEYSTSFSQYKSGAFAMFATSLTGTISNNLINFSLRIKDPHAKDKYRISGTVSQPSTGNYDLKVAPGDLMLNYDTWTVNNGNLIQLLNGDLVAHQFSISKGGQQLTLNSIGTGNNRPLSIDFRNFNIGTLTALVQTDSLLVNGMVNGNVLVKDFKTQPVFTSDLTITDFSVYSDTLGTLTAKVNNAVANQYNADLALTGRGNDIKATGVYYVKPGNKSSFDFAMNINQLQMKSLEGPSRGALRNASGSLSGTVTLKGTLEDPRLLGKINFDNTAFNLGMLNSYFKVNNESLVVDNNGFLFDSFIVQDSANNNLVVDGRVNTTDFSTYAFNLKVNSDNFQVMNTSKKDNKIFYGKMVVSTSLNIRGTNDEPVVDGSVTVNDQTNFTVVMPQAEPAIVEREGIVRFVDADATSEDSLFLLPYDSLNLSRLVGFDVSTNITIDRNAQFNLIVDEANGDFINMKGEGLLTAGIDPSGKITLVGSYELDEGAYEISFNFLRRRFDIQKGSRILWTGEPTKADIDVSAVYIANASPLDLVANQISTTDAAVRNTYRQKLPFEVWLTLRGDLMKPAITFDIRLPEDKNYIVSKDIISAVQNKLLQIREEPGEMNKQVFALLLLSRFVNENPFSNSGGGIDAAEFARQSVSKLLTEQLNNLAGGLIAGVDINFNLTTAADYTTGEKRSRTDFTVGLTKRLLGDRLTVTVGSNFELQGPKQTSGNGSSNNIAGNVAIDYNISRDGRYVLRIYRKNEYEGVIEGYIVETGVGFIMNVDYDHFRELLQRSKQKKNRKTPVTTPMSDKSKLPEPVKPDKRGK